MNGKTESAVSVSMSASTRMIITIISVIFVAKRLAITQEEKRLVPKGSLHNLWSGIWKS